MWTRLFHILALFGYLNILFYEAGVNNNMRINKSCQQYLTGDSILEFVLDDVLDIPIHIPEEDVEIQFENYRMVTFDTHILPVLIFVFGFLYSIVSISKVKIHPLYCKKNACLSGFYSHLYKFSLF